MQKTFAEQVDEVLAGEFPFYTSLKVCDTPQILLDVGCKQLPMLYTQRHLKNAIKKKTSNEHTHGLTIKQIKQLPELIKKPLMIMDSISNPQSIIIVTNQNDLDNLPIMVSVKPNGKGRYELEEIYSNFITSVYGRNNFEQFFERIVKTDNLLYCNKKSQVLFERWGEQYSELTKSLDFNIIIHKSRNIVNEFEKKTKAENVQVTTPLSRSRIKQNAKRISQRNEKEISNTRKDKKQER